MKAKNGIVPIAIGITDYLGTPTHGYDETGKLVWERELDIYGSVRKEKGEKGLVPQLYQGQYVDEETGLAYNRFRYYDNESGGYISQDPIGLDGGNPSMYGYVIDTNTWIDEFGLECKKGRSGKQKRLKELDADPKQPKHIRGWIKQEKNEIARGKKKHVRNPPGYELAHERGREAAKGFGYEHSNPQTTVLHKTQHKFDDFGRKNKIRPVLDE